MKQHKRNTYFRKNMVLVLILCLLTSFVEAQIFCPVTEFAQPQVRVGMEEGECSIGFISRGRSTINLISKLKEVINAQLEQVGEFPWISVKSSYIDSYNDKGDYYSGRLVFDVANNFQPGYEREVVFKNTLNQFMQLIQDGQDPEYHEIIVYNVSSDCEPGKAFPGRKTKVTLSGSQVGILYVIGNDTIQGTGYPLSFEKVFPEGLYTLKAIKGRAEKEMSGSVGIYYYPFLKAGYCTEEMTREGILPPVGESAPGCGFGKVTLPFFQLMSSSDLAQLDEMLEQINNGKSSCFPGFRIHRINSTISMATGPNLRGGDRINEVYFSLDNANGGKMFRVLIHTILQQQDLVKFTLSELSRESIENYSLKLDGFQYGVKYKLFKDGVFVREEEGFVLPPVFRNLSGGGIYTLEAHYWDTIVPMNGTVYIDGGCGVASYVRENRYIEENEPVSTYVYYDGMGRGIQSRQVDPSIDGRDVIAPVVYDSTGRESKNYLPFSVSNCKGFRQYALSEQNEYYTNKFGVNHYAYSETKYSNRPEDQIVEQSSYGEKLKMGSGHTVKTNVRQYTTGDNVKKIRA